jgi:penicillin-binding protein A
MTSNRTKGLTLLFIFLMTTALYFLVDRMISDKDAFFHAVYEDKQNVDLIERAIADHIFRSEDGKIVIDAQELANERISKRAMARLRAALPYLYTKKGEIFFDQLSLSIANNRAPMEDDILRGSFVDRHSTVLAYSHIDEKHWRQERHYAFGPQFYPVIGHFSAVFGKRGLEEALDRYLDGNGHSPVYRSTSEPFRSLQLGDNVMLTLDARLQEKGYDLMKGKKGAIVVLDVRTGEVLAAVSTPSFDPNERSTAKWREAFADETDKPYENRAFSGLYPPGSTFKTVVASAWIERDRTQEGLEDAYHTVCTGRKNRYGISDIHVHGREDLKGAFADSCNVYFSEIGVKLGRSLLTYAEGYGFNNDIDLLPQMNGIKDDVTASLAFSYKDYVKDVINSFSILDFRRNPRLVAQGSIGQNIVAATPLQMAMVAAAIANRGVLMNPYLVRKIATGDGRKVVFSAQPVQMGNPIREETALKLAGMMEAVIARGTGKDVEKIYLEDGRYFTSSRGARGAEIPVAGKTGTADVGDINRNGRMDNDEKPDSWFIGFAPANKPRFAVAVVAENQGFGSLTAAPIAVNMLAEALNQSLSGE